MDSQLSLSRTLKDSGQPLKLVHDVGRKGNYQTLFMKPLLSLCKQRTGPLQGMVDGQAFIVHMRESTAMRQLEVSRAGRESSRLKMASRLDGAMRRETGKAREEEKERAGEVDQERGTGEEDKEEQCGYKDRVFGNEKLGEGNW